MIVVVELHRRVYIMCTYEAILYSKKNFLYADSLKKDLRDIDIELVYANQPSMLADFILDDNIKIIFLDNVDSELEDALSEIITNSRYFYDYLIIFLQDSNRVLKRGNDKIKYMTTPIRKNELLRCLETYKSDVETSKVDMSLCGIEKDITVYLRSIGFSQKLLGFQYIKHAIFTVIKYNYNLKSLNREVYPKLADYFHTNQNNIERNIRSAIQNAVKEKDFEKCELCCNDITTRTFLNFLLDKVYTSINSKKSLVN